MVSVWDWSARYCTYRREQPSLLGLLTVRFRVYFWRMVGALYLFWRLSQCIWVLKVSVLETGHTRHGSTSGSDRLRQPYGLCHKHQPPKPSFVAIDFPQVNTSRTYTSARFVGGWGFNPPPPSGASQPPSLYWPHRQNSQNKSKINCWTPPPPALVFTQIQYWRTLECWWGVSYVYATTIELQRTVASQKWDGTNIFNTKKLIMALIGLIHEIPYQSQFQSSKWLVPNGQGWVGRGQGEAEAGSDVARVGSGEDKDRLRQDLMWPGLGRERTRIGWGRIWCGQGWVGRGQGEADAGSDVARVGSGEDKERLMQDLMWPGLGRERTRRGWCRIWCGQGWVGRGQGEAGAGSDVARVGSGEDKERLMQDLMWPGLGRERTRRGGCRIWSVCSSWRRIVQPNSQIVFQMKRMNEIGLPAHNSVSVWLGAWKRGSDNVHTQKLAVGWKSRGDRTPGTP